MAKPKSLSPTHDQALGGRPERLQTSYSCCYRYSVQSKGPSSTAAVSGARESFTGLVLHLWLINPAGTKRYGVRLGCISPQEWVKHFSGLKTLPQRGPRNKAGCRALHRQMDSLEFSAPHFPFCAGWATSGTGMGGAVSILCARTGQAVLGDPPTGSTE